MKAHRNSDRPVGEGVASSDSGALRSGRDAVIGIGCIALASAASAAPPPLPTPCAATSCGGNAQQFVQYGKAGATVSGNTMNVTQSSTQAILNWANFNIASGYKVNFQQPSATASVLNKIWSANPSTIAGALTANGQVYLYNQNGIIFDKGSQVNVGSLIASTLPLNPVNGDPDYLFKNGVLSNNNNTTGGGTLPAAFQAPQGQFAGDVIVRPGATLTAADGGRIMLLGSAVTNQGSITTPDGQTILGAGTSVYLAASTDPALRGLLIEVASGGTVENDGQISAPRGNITLAGMVVNQAGQVSATTSVSANGSIYLVAGDTSSPSDPKFYSSSAAGFGGLLPNEGGTVTLEPGSVTQITPDTGTGTLSEGNLQNFIPSQVNLVGQQVTLQGNATVRAPGATVSLNAEADPAAVVAGNSGHLTGPIAQTYANDGGRIYLDSGSTIDVSGLTNVSVAASNDILQVTLEGNDLANDPLLRSGFLHGLSVTVNANEGSPLFDVTPYKGNIPLGINQILTNAGTIQLNSNGDIIARAGSTLNVSGGSVAYQGGYAPTTTKLIGADGKVYDIGDAPNTVQYVGLANSYSYTDPTWGTTTKSSTQSYYAGYLQGANAGTISVAAPQIYLRGTEQAQTVTGIYQRTAATLPEGGLFELGCNCKIGTSQDFRAPSVEFLNNLADTLGSDFNYNDLNTSLPLDLRNATLLSPSLLSQGGFNRLAIFSNGGVVLPPGTNLRLAPGGTLGVTSAQSISIDGNISAPGGAISLNAAGGGTSVGGPQVSVSLGSGAIIDTAGTWTNDSPTVTSVVGTGPVVLDGGSVDLTAYGEVILGYNSRIDVSGGGWMNSSNQLSTGAAGKITLQGSYFASDAAPSTGLVQLDAGATLAGASLRAGQGGTLAITSGSVTVGTTVTGTPGELLLAPDFFSNQGFQNYSITGQNGVTIGSSDATDPQTVVVNPIQETLAFTQNALLQPTGTSLESFTALESLPISLRKPANINFNATSAVVSGQQVLIPGNGSILLAEGASIVTDPLGSVSLTTTSDTGNITVLGSIVAPAGDITLQIGKPRGLGKGYIANQQILLGPDSILNASAYALIDTLDTKGYREGSVLSGGTISLQANKGFVVTDPGSLIDVSGTAGVIDVVSSSGVKPTTVAGNAGTILIDAFEGIALQGNLAGQAATFDGQTVAGAGAGSLTIGLDLFDYTSVATASSGSNFPFSLNTRTLTLSDQPPSALPNTLPSGVAQISTQTIEGGGFDNVTLKSSDVISVSGNVSLSSRASLTLDAPVLEAAPGSSLQLSSAYVALGNFFNQADYFDLPQYGGIIPVQVNPNASTVIAPGCGGSACTGMLQVNASLIDIRGLSGWSGFSNETLNSSGDVRFSTAQNLINTTPLRTAPGDSTVPGLLAGLNTTGDLVLNAQQVYPTTSTNFTVASSSSVTINPPGGIASALLPPTPLSAGGILAIDAPTITQNGVLRAPLGEITLQGVDTQDAAGNTVAGTVTLGNGSTTSVSAGGLVIPYGSTLNGQQWTYSPDSQVTQVIGAPPAKTINLNASNVSINNGATVDLSGGGDLLAYEWIAGPGGSKDVLSAAGGSYQYAIVPTLGSQYSPIDAQYLQGAWPTGQTIYLSGVPGLAAGTYALLPARYALLPGAYAINVVKQDSNLPAGSAIAQPGGSYVATGQFGVWGTNILDSQTSTFLVAPSSVVNSQSQYNTSYANTFFSSAAATNHTATPSLPADAGALQISTSGSLKLDGTLNAAAGSYVSGTDSSGKPITVQGAGAVVSIEAPSLLIVDSSTEASATSNAASNSTGNAPLVLDAQTLDKLGAQTLVLGATVQNTSAGEQITVDPNKGAASVELDNLSVALTGPQVILAARDNVTLDSGALLNATGTLNRTPKALVMQGGGALLVASSGGAAPLQVTSTTQDPVNPTGLLSLGSKASVQATGNIVLYSTGDTTAAPDAILAAPALGLYSSRVSIGEVPNTDGAAPNGLNLTGQLLSQLAGVNQLTIGSTSTIDLYGTVNVGTAASGSAASSNITLDAWALNGYGAGDKIFQAGSVSFVNTNRGTAPADVGAGTGSGTLTVRAVGSSSGNSGQINLGTGDKVLSGFGAVNFSADGDIQAHGTGSLTVLAGANGRVPVTLQAMALTASSSSDQSIVAQGAVTISQAAANNAPVATAPLGGKLSIQGDSIAQNGTIELPAGIIALRATSGDIVLGQGSVTSAAGSSKDFVVTSAVAAGGQISLTADAGNVTFANGATVDLSGTSSPDGKVSGAAGSLNISAPNGQFTFAGSILKGSAPTGQQQGNFTLDVGSGLAGPGLDSLDSALSSGGFTGALDLRTRGDAQVSLTGNVVASSFQLSSDQGAIDISGTINTSAGGGNALATDGGTIAVWAGNNLTLEPSARLLANAGAPGPTGVNGSALTTHGGDITLGTENGSLILNGGTIRMLGSSGTSADGTLTLRAPRTPDQTGVNIQTSTSGTVEVDTHNPIVVEGFQCYGPCSVADRSQPASSLTLDPDTSGEPVDITQSGNVLADALTFVGNGNGALLASSLARGFSNNLGAAAPVQVQVRPGVEIDSTGDIVVGAAGVNSVWDLDSWNAALGAPVNLTLRAGGNLIFNASLSDGFTNDGSPVATWTFGGSGAATDLATNNIAAGVTASYRLAAGADLTAANPLAVKPATLEPVDGSSTASDYQSAPGTGNLILTPGNLIRTGDGNIDIAAGGDVLMGYSLYNSTESYDSAGNLKVTENDPLTSVIYTAGVPTTLTSDQSQLFQAATNFLGVSPPAYPTMGGNITVAATGDIRSAPSVQMVSDWLWRRGAVNITNAPGTLVSTDENTTWWIEFGNFNQGIGALGGGNVALNAGGNIVNVSAVIPTTGELLGAAGTTPIASNLILNGGGQLHVRAGGDIESGIFEDDWGNAAITAGGGLTAGTTLGTELTGLNLAGLGTSVNPKAPIYPVLLLGGGTFDVSARSSVEINFVGNSTALPEAFTDSSRARGGQSYFYTYTPATALNIASSGGDVVVGDSVSNLPVSYLIGRNGLPHTYASNAYTVVYPGTLNVTALSGDITILENNSQATNPGDSVIAGLPYYTGLDLFPSPTGNLSLLAQGYITGSTDEDLTSQFAVTMYETDPTLWGNILFPRLANAVIPSPTSLPQVPLHQDDPQPIYIVAKSGGISAGVLTFPKQADVIAGGDIADLTYTGKNLNPSDVTLIEAGGQISYATPTSGLNNQLNANKEGITLGGPGYLEVLAGGTLNLGDSSGIVTSGSLADTRLPSTGATALVGAGFGSNSGGGIRQPAYQAFTDAYLAPDASGNPSAYSSDLIAYMQQLYPTVNANLSYGAALTAFEALTPAQRLPLLAQVLNDELSITGIDHTVHGDTYDRGYAAINKLFPAKDAQNNTLSYQGDINMFFSQIKTEKGGNINLLDPGGSVVVGVPNPPAALDQIKTNGSIAAAANLGLLVLGQGAIEGFADQSFEVNTSRILTLEGGDIILWASNGNIDAGKGAKSASAAPPPIVQTDANGNVFVNPINDISGSGIGQLLSGPGETAGLVNLIAPRGAVNAGDAGIRVAGNLNLAAQQVIGANNITVGGTATGVPVSEAGALSGALSGANSLADASKSVVGSLTQDLSSGTNFQQLSESLVPTFIVVKMFCLGLDCKTQ